MRLISEQGAVRLDQLARFLDCNPEAIEELAARLCAGNFATRHAFLAGEPQWIALTWVGNRLADTPLDWFRPRPGGVRHWLALNELRLYIRQCSPNAEWLSRRLLLKTHGRTAKVPGAEVRLGGKRFAINYRLTPNNGGTLVPRADLQNDAYDAVIFFCATPRTRLFMERLQRQHRWSKVAVRDMPDPELIASESREVKRLVDSLLEP